ncbi:MFS transporter [Streptomyces bauhiniae]
MTARVGVDASAPATGSGRPRSLGRDYQLIWCAAVGSRFGDNVRMAALALLTARITDDPRWLGLVAACNYVPWLLFGLLSGAAVDRVNKRLAFMIGDLGRAALVALLACAVLTDWVSLPLLIVFALLLSTLQTISDSSFNPMIPLSVGKEDLPRAHARLSAAQGLAGQFSGAPVGAVLFATARAVPFFVDAATFLAAALLISQLRTSAATESGRLRDVRMRPLLQDIAVGLRYIVGDRTVSTYAYTVAIMNFAAVGTQSTLVLYVTRELHASATAFGLMSAFWGGGAIIGNMLAEPLSRRLSPQLLSASAVAVQVTGYALIASAPGPGLAFAGMTVYGLTAGVWNVTANSVVQAHAPTELLGRLSSALRMISLGTAPLGALVGGALAAGVSLRAPAAAAVPADVAAAVLISVRVLLPARRTAKGSL